MLLLVDQEARAKSGIFRSRVRGSLVAQLRAEINEAGAGPKVPEFKQSTRRQ
jgi:hypothetical protein